MDTRRYSIPPQAQRCTYLFASLLGFIMLLPLIRHMEHARAMANGLQWLILLTAIVAIGRTTRLFVAALGLVIPALVLFLLGLSTGDGYYLMLSRACSTLFYAVTISCLLHYVLQQETMNTDRLYGAASIYLMMGMLWAYLYTFLLEYNPKALNGIVLSETDPLTTMIKVMYFSFTTLTTAGYGDVTPAIPTAQMLANVEQITGTLFVAILIARLVGFYSPPQGGDS